MTTPTQPLSMRALVAGALAMLTLSACGLQERREPVSYGAAVPAAPTTVPGLGGPERLGSAQTRRTVEVPPVRPLPTFHHLGYTWPTVATPRITSPFGWRSDPFTGKRSFHHGLDIGCWTGQSIIASKKGTVMWAGRAEVYGNVVVLAHKYGVLTIYGHMKDIHARPGVKVKAGTILGTCGSSGRSSGPHLHFEVRHGDTVYDPVRFLSR